MTGFSKRKKAKQAEKVKRAISREKDALREMRTQVRPCLSLCSSCRSVGDDWRGGGTRAGERRDCGRAPRAARLDDLGDVTVSGLADSSPSPQVREKRKEQAAHNVRMAREAYGGASRHLASSSSRPAWLFRERRPAEPWRQPTDDS